MKVRHLFAAVVAIAIAIPAIAQDSPPADSGSFVQSAQNYFTSFNPTLESTFDSRGAVWTGVDSLQGGEVALANALGVSYQVYKLVSVETVMRNSGVAGTLVSEQAGLSLNFKVHDARLTLYCDAGYDIAKKSATAEDRVYGEIGLRASKALTEHTFAGVGIAAQIPDNRQVFSAFAGFTF